MDKKTVNKNNMIVEQFRDGIFRSASRTYGEQYIEPILRKYYGWDESKGGANDAVGNEGQLIEIKASKVLLSTEKKQNISLVDRIISENHNDVINRLVSFDDCYEAEYYANMQNVKRDHFDELYYVMLFEDCLKIFVSKKEDISSIPNWSDKHGRYDEHGKSGQFAIKKANISWHIENNLKTTLTWDEVYNIAKENIL